MIALLRGLANLACWSLLLAACVLFWLGVGLLIGEAALWLVGWFY